jgi:hypothetical protein
VNAHLSEGFKRCLGPRALSLPKNKLLSHNINNFKKFYFSAHGRTATSLFVFLVHQTEAAPANGSGMEIEYPTPTKFKVRLVPTHGDYF